PTFFIHALPTCLHSLLCLPRPLPPSSRSLCPYTTLFRSLGFAGASVRKGVPAPVQAGLRWVVEMTQPHYPAQASLDRGRHALAEDRKSTRLNSSHVEMSYAVFCLKKITSASR